MHTNKPPPQNYYPKVKPINPWRIVISHYHKTSTDAMIVINNKLAKEVIANAIKSGRVSSGSSPHAYLLQSLIHLNFAFDVRKDPGLIIPRDLSLDEWSSTEIAVADTLNWLVAFLEKINCHNIEQLLRDVADYRSRHLDYPEGPWPYVKGPK